MKKKIIRIFLASSLDEFKEERDKLDPFLNKIARKLRNRYIERGIYIDIEPLRCEDVDPKLNAKRKQDEYNELIKGCEICVFLIFTKVGGYTLEEFDTAHGSFVSSGCEKPKIYTFFKQVKDGKIEDSVKDFMEKLDKELQHFYTFFDSIDTVKLKLLLSLSILNSDFIEVSYDDGKCYVNGSEELDISNASQFANNRTLKEFKTELENVEKEYYSLRSGYPYDDEDKNRRYRDIALRRQFLKDTIEELEKQIFNMTLNICKDEATGKEITARMKEAYRLFEQGDLDGANSILDYAEIEDDFLRDEKILTDTLKKRAALYIRESKAKITFLTADINNPGRFGEIEEIYTKVVSKAKQYLVGLDVLYYYASYLDDQGHSDRAYSVAKELENIYESGRVTVEISEKARLYNLLGMICHNHSSKAKEAEEYYLNAIEIYEKLASENPERYNAALATSYNNAGVFFAAQGQAAEAEAYYLKSIEISEKLASENSERYDADLAESYNNAGTFYADQGQAAKAEEYYLKAIEIKEKLAKENPERYSADLAMSYNNAGNFYDDQGQVAKAEAYYLKAIEIYEKLAKENPERYNAVLAGSYNNAGNFYKNQGQAAKAEEYYLKAIEIREKLANENPERYSADLAASYNNAGNFYYTQGQAAKAEEYYIKAIKIRKKLASENPERYNADLAGSYNNAGVFYADQGQASKAEEYYLKAIEIKEKLASENSERYSADLAMSYNNAGNFYYAQGQAAKAEAYYLKAIEIREKLASENPERYSADLAMSYNNAGIFYKNQGQAAKAEAYYLKAIEIREKLASENPERFFADLAQSYNNAGIFYKNQGQAAKAEKYYLKAIEIYKELALRNPERYNADLAISYWNYGLFKNDKTYYDKAYELAKNSLHNPYSRQIVKIYEEKFGG